MAGTRDGGDPPGGDPAVAASRDALALVFREEGSRLTASVTRVLGDSTPPKKWSRTRC
jgi:hypothetical protein